MKFKGKKAIMAAALSAIAAAISTGSLGVSAADFLHNGFKYWVCDEGGHSHDVTCPCGGIAKEPHDSNVRLTVSFDNATCTEMGYDSGTKCSVCGYITSYHYTTPALGHDWDNGTITVQPTITSSGVKTLMCSRCYKTKTEVIPKLTDSPTPTPTWEKGDANCDGRVNAEDATAILKHTVGIMQLSEQGCKNADMDDNGKVTAADATAILKSLVSRS